MANELFPVEHPSVVRRVSLVRLSAEIARSLAVVGRIAVAGEVHRPKAGSGGRTWFTLRERVAQVDVTCPANRASRCRVVEGERVSVTGRLIFANERGQLLLEAEEVVPVGDGAVAAAIAERRQRLAAEGLLDRPRLPIPVLPRAIGVVCGFEAAVRADIESVVSSRFPGYPVRYVEVTVSGPGASQAVTHAVVHLDQLPEIEVIVLARGGGDAAALLPFSDEDLCRAICASSTPVVTAIGHDGDRPLCDEVADLRCGTPSLAAAAVVPDRLRMLAYLDDLAERAESAIAAHADDATRRLASLDRQRALASARAVAQARLSGSHERLALVHPGARLESARRHLAGIAWSAPVLRRSDTARHGLANHRRQLELLHPRRVLERGYAVARAEDGSVVRSASTLSPGEVVVIELGAGRVRSRVEEIMEVDDGR
ncbi:MAG: exodeoxyribonuclease VII large subunit [Acidimicrobiales bacterium]